MYGRAQELIVCCVVVDVVAVVVLLVLGLVEVVVVVVGNSLVEVVDLPLADVEVPAAAFIQAYFPVDRPAA